LSTCLTSILLLDIQNSKARGNFKWLLYLKISLKLKEKISKVLGERGFKGRLRDVGYRGRRRGGQEEEYLAFEGIRRFNTAEHLTFHRFTVYRRFSNGFNVFLSNSTLLYV